MSAYSITISGEKFLLLPEKALFHPKLGLLFIADVHLGKITHFRKSGIPVPHLASSDNFERMGQLFSRFCPHKVFFLGDVFHSLHNSDWLRFQSFKDHFPEIQFTLIRGNHDRSEKEEILQMYFDEVFLTEMIWNDFLLTHEPTLDSSLFNFCGHIHPAVRIRGSARQSLKLSCFYASKNALILPAFGTFTGNHTLELGKGDVAYAIIKGDILKIEK